MIKISILHTFNLNNLMFLFLIYIFLQFKNKIDEAILLNQKLKRRDWWNCYFQRQKTNLNKCSIDEIQKNNEKLLEFWKEEFFNLDNSIK